VRTIAANAARSHLRREGTRTLVPLDDELPAPDAAPDAAFAAEEQRGALRRALERLPPRQREVVRMRIYLELPHAEIARRLGSNENAAKVNFHHAIKNLRRMLSGESDAHAGEP
jgi:RNA polymerase sigma-70 factor (ECF subfamily)